MVALVGSVYLHIDGNGELEKTNMPDGHASLFSARNFVGEAVTLAYRSSSR